MFGRGGFECSGSLLEGAVDTTGAIAALVDCVFRTGRWVNAAGFFRISQIVASDSALRFIPALIAIPTVVVLVEEKLAVVFECALFFGDNGSSISRVNVLSFFGPLSEVGVPMLAAKFARSVNSAEEELVLMIGRGGFNFEIYSEIHIDRDRIC